MRAGDVTALADFAHSKRWTAWRNEMRGGKPTKVPYSAVGQMAESDNPATWLTQADATAVADIIVNGMGGGHGIWLGTCGERFRMDRWHRSRYMPRPQDRRDRALG